MNFTTITPILLLEFQVKHYAERVANARSIEERMWLRKQHYDLKQRLSTYLN